MYIRRKGICRSSDKPKILLAICITGCGIAGCATFFYRTHIVSERCCTILQSLQLESYAKVHLCQLVQTCQHSHTLSMAVSLTGFRFAQLITG